MILQAQTALSAMERIASYVDVNLSALGITPEAYTTTFEDVPWNVGDRRKVVQTINALCFGSCDAAGIDRIDLPSEYIAAVISAFVSPCNHHLACNWMAAETNLGYSADELASGADASSLQPTKPSQLLALIQVLNCSDKTHSARQQFERRMNEAQKRAMRGQNQGKVNA
jgi:hypothetical protein